uniref:Uncharacterized protein n=1 Tax=Hanusia phi TaxID=3032 RepID=A0A7S0HPE6_9CRYP
MEEQVLDLSMQLAQHEAQNKLGAETEVEGAKVQEQLEAVDCLHAREEEFREVIRGNDSIRQFCLTLVKTILQLRRSCEDLRTRLSEQVDQLPYRRDAAALREILRQVQKDLDNERAATSQLKERLTRLEQPGVSLFKNPFLQ